MRFRRGFSAEFAPDGQRNIVAAFVGEHAGKLIGSPDLHCRFVRKCTDLKRVLTDFRPVQVSKHSASTKLPISKTSSHLKRTKLQLFFRIEKVFLE